MGVYYSPLCGLVGQLGPCWISASTVEPDLQRLHQYRVIQRGPPVVVTSLWAMPIGHSLQSLASSTSVILPVALAVHGRSWGLEGGYLGADLDGPLAGRGL